MLLEEIIEKVLSKENSAFFYTPPLYKHGVSFLFSNPVEEITAGNPDEFFNALLLIDTLREKGLIGYGFITYEAGYLFEKKLKNYFAASNDALLKFFFFKKDDVKKFKSSEIDFSTAGYEKDYNISGFRLNTSKSEFIKNIEKIKDYISEGDTYQVNYTVKGKFKFGGSYCSLLKRLLFNQSAAYTAFINNGDEIILSISPELFFHIDGNKITTAPMKGTLPRGKNIIEDSALSKLLKHGKKFRAENLMIVDLLRNDLGRIAKTGSVKVDKLFHVEKYESLYQMVSKISAELKPQLGLKDIFENIFPCGSITGAPKIRTMEIINELEKEKRGIYTGAIGLIGKDKSVFNVAIRTIKINKKSGEGEVGLGGGIIWDSNPKHEFQEALLKGKFLLQPDEYFELFETMLVERKKIILLDKHLLRLKKSANYFLFKYDKAKILRSINKILQSIKDDKRYRLRLSLDKWGNVKRDLSEFMKTENNVKIIISEKRIDSENRFQYFKTTNRKLYDSERSNFADKGFFDVIFLNEKGEVAEGAITNIFIKRGGKWFTPPIESGILEGVCRNFLLKKNKPQIVESVLSLDDLICADEIFLTNALRGKINVGQLVLPGKKVINYN